ncbi:MAG TPA: NifB/NifX family molybdenum-iron cluster-binding protein [Syntrophales bacterium]|nr:NifB/NifX family molybdenum-iron cluster-binding protein [Syntrophales bacterium]HOM08241.1 NifB/NifX family molybdenum-iron cluster-binding protein [Syntrophales bacterium]HPQ06640.1 NifB/NifX family molybdenum-iron cluster-binding protein [Syntrophales bacterium]
MKKIAVCQLAERIAPLYDTAPEIAFLLIGDNGRVLERWTINVSTITSAERTDMLDRLGVELVICGGAKQECQRNLKEHNIRFIDNVIGNVENVIARYLEGQLHSGDVID